MRKQMKNAVTGNLIVGLVLAGLVMTAHAADPTDAYALLIQQSPADGGSVTPGSGVHKFEIGQTVSLSAIPRQGYRFLYWLGDVSAAGSTDTTIQLDSPKMVVAVFSREAYEEELPGVSLIKGATAGGGGGGRTLNPMQSPASVSPGSYYDPPNIYYSPFNPFEPPTNDFNDDIPTPGGNSDDIPVPGEDDTNVPEPATVVMLGLGSLALLKRRKTK